MIISYTWMAYIQFKLQQKSNIKKGMVEKWIKLGLDLLDAEV